MSHRSTSPQTEVPFRACSTQPQAPAADDPSLPVLPPGTAIVIDAPPPENVTGPGVPARVPHIGHALLFIALAGFVLLLTQAILLALSPVKGDPQKIVSAAVHPKLLVASMAISYVIALLASFFFFPLLWQRSFGNGIQWDFAMARRNLHKLIPIGLITGFTVQALSSLIPVPKSLPMDDFFRSTSDVWLVTAFGTLLAPLFEEIAFRGFLFPAFAIAYDWLSLPKTPAAHERWRTTTSLTFAALVFSAVVSSILFALLHAQQLAHAWGALGVLFVVSLILTLVRIRTRSVACSAIVHACYNFSVFLTLFIATGGYRHLERMAR